MRCPRCDAKLEQNVERCHHCGQDLAMIKHVYRLSNTYYNIGLEKAKVRDLSGAAESLKKSLQFNKKNTDARNLLGLVYCEMGETVAALSEWVLSKYLQPQDNAADAYIDTIQANPAGLENVNQTIKKYNAALTAAKSRNEDLAIIQLKKVVMLNPKFIRALQLLGLLYMQMDDYQKAYKYLKMAKRIDSSNTITLRYMREVCSHLQRPPVDNRQPVTRSNKDPLANVTPVGSYREEKKSWIPYMNVVIGLVIGILVSIFLIRPTLQKTTNGSSTELAEVKDQLTVKNTELNSAKKENETLKTQVEELKNQANGTTATPTASPAKTTGEDGKPLTSKDANKLFLSGRDKYNSGKYDAAIEDLTNALAIEPENLDALYFMGRVYHQKKDYDKAKEYYDKVVEIDKNSSRASEAKSRLNQLKSVMGSSKNKATATPKVTATPRPTTAPME